MDGISTSGAAEWLLVRHAPRAEPHRLAGRTDLPAELPEAGALSAVASLIGPFDHLVSSPALRCRQTAEALFPDREAVLDARLWEQDFGDWDGRAHSDIPDIGAMGRAALAAHCPPGGESFLDMARRALPALIALPAGRSLIVAHAGTVRAALGHALGDLAAGLAFEVAPLSATLIRALPGGAFSIGFVNRCAAR
ncbi:MAG: histidine phosphatase family protein [Notoacmeibacter sp.]|nr:histidine phosphatase family protein [Notoacmeibacter sp.]MCC0031987.1 histidine phosphatase family protein [Brucellaceae bacterium]